MLQADMESCKNSICIPSTWDEKLSLWKHSHICYRLEGGQRVKVKVTKKCHILHFIPPRWTDNSGNCDDVTRNCFGYVYIDHLIFFVTYHPWQLLLALFHRRRETKPAGWSYKAGKVGNELRLILTQSPVPWELPRTRRSSLTIFQGISVIVVPKLARARARLLAVPHSLMACLTFLAQFLLFNYVLLRFNQGLKHGFESVHLWPSLKLL